MSDKFEIKPRTGITTDEQFEEPQSTTEAVTQKPLALRRKHTGIREILGRGLLAAIVAKGSWDIGANLGSMVAQNIPPSVPTLTLSNENQSSMPEVSKQEIEQKYNINILTMKEAFAMMHENYDEQDPASVGQRPPVRWNNEQLSLLNDMFSYLPKSLYGPSDDKKLGIFIGDFGTDCQCAGISYNQTGIIGVHSDAINPQNREGFLSLLVHELTHRLDASTQYKLWDGVNAVLADKSYLKLPDFNFKGRDDLNYDKLNRLNIVGLTYDDKLGALLTLNSFASEKGFAEGIAGVSQRYVTGHERFMRAIGPLLDGNGYPEPTEFPHPTAYRSSDSTAEPSTSLVPVFNKDLAALYPKTQALYDLYKTEVFQGKEYDTLTLLKISTPPEEWQKKPQELKNEQKELKEERIHQQEQNQIYFPDLADIEQIEQTEGVERIIKDLEDKYGVIFVSEASVTEDEMIRIDKMLSLFPKDLYTKEGKDKLMIILFSGVGQVPRGNSHILSINYLHSQGIHYGSNVLYAVSKFAVDIVEKKDASDGNRSKDKIIEILGGEKFLNSPESEYPVLKKLKDLHTNFQGDLLYAFDYENKADSEDIFRELAGIYVGGWETFSRVAEITDPSFTRSELISSNFDRSITKAGKLYEVFKKIYGVEFTGKIDDHGIPETVSASE